METSRSLPVVVTLGPEAPAFVAEALQQLPDVDVVEGAPATTVIQASGAEVLVVDVLDVAELRARLDEPSRPARQPPKLLAITGVLDPRTASWLEDLGIAYADVDGRAWLPGRGRTHQARARRAAGHQLLRPESLRLAQLLADHPHERWTQRSLAARGDSTQVTAQRLLRRLEDEGLVAREGAGPETSRHVVDQPALRAWLLEHAKPGRVVRLAFFVRDHSQIPSQVENVHLALTGAAAADRIGVPVLTNPSLPAYRANCGPERLEDVPALLGGLRTDQGANATLIADPARLAHVDGRTLADGTLVAPPSRIMLDLLLERRGVAAAQLFADLWQHRDT
jgi:hypothetical protein